jgi:hypothetical protein
LPVRIPANIDPKRAGIDMSLLLLRESPQGEILEYKDLFDLRRTGLLPADREQIKTAAIFNRPIVDDERVQTDQDDDAREVASTAKRLFGYSNSIIELRDELLPPHSLMWQNVDHLVLCSDRIRDDSAGLATIRDWLHRGGRVWAGAGCPLL